MLETSTGQCGPVMQTNEVQDFCRKGAKVEVLAPSNRWREAQVVRVGGGVARIHYTGYDAQFDEEVGGQGLKQLQLLENCSENSSEISCNLGPGYW